MTRQPFLKFLLNIADIFGYMVTRSAIALMQHAPQPISLKFARLCISILLTLMPRAKAVGRRNLELIFPNKSVAERERILSASFDTLAKHLVDFCKVPMLTKERAAKMFDYSEVRPVWDEVRVRAPKGVGCLIVTMHFGSFELLGQAHALLDRPLSILSRPLGSSRLERFFNKRREMFGNKQFTREGGAREIIHRLKAGEDVLIVMDQNVRLHHAVFVNFCGVQAATSKVAALAALRTGAPLFFAAAVEERPEQYKILFSPIPDPNSFSGSIEEKIVGVTEAIHVAFEKALRAYPEQWMWIHRRFKTRPEGEVENLYGGKAVATR